MVKQHKKLLQVGQHVWIETADMFRANEPRTVIAHEVVRANKSSAYISPLDEVRSARKDDRYIKYLLRVSQKTHEVHFGIMGFDKKLWLTKEDFQRNVQLSAEYKALHDQAFELVKKMNLQQLRAFVEDTNY